MNLKDFKKELKKNPRYKKYSDEFEAKKAKLKKNGGKWCRHNATIGGIGAEKHLCGERAESSL